MSSGTLNRAHSCDVSEEMTYPDWAAHYYYFYLGIKSEAVQKSVEKLERMLF